tara:strand:- start:2733 stop:4700 length:1968 start_codon:yes stop_codon:yes gene_type:complete
MSLPITQYVTYANLGTLITNSALQKGVQYHIYDRADLGIRLTATSTNTISLEGQGGFYNPDFQDVGDYSGVAAITGIAAGARKYIWQESLEYVTIVITSVSGTFTPGDSITMASNASGILIATDNSTYATVLYTTAGNRGAGTILNDTTSGASASVIGPITYNMVLGDIVIWNGLHYQFTNIDQGGGVTPDVNTAAYTVLPKPTPGMGIGASDVGYIEEWDVIEFDFTNDWLQYRADKLGNTFAYSKAAADYYFNLLGYSAIVDFQWGNTTKCFGNKISQSRLSNLNTIGSVFGNVLDSGATMLNNIVDADAFLSDNTLCAGSYIHDNTISSGSFIQGNTLYSLSNIQFCTLTTNSSIQSNILDAAGAMSANTLDASNIQSNLLSGGSIMQENALSGTSFISTNTMLSAATMSLNTLSGSSVIVFNSLSSAAAIQYNTLDEGSYIQTNTLQSASTMGLNSLISTSGIDSNTLQESSVILGNTLSVTAFSPSTITNNLFSLNAGIENKTIDPGVSFQKNTVINKAINATETISATIEYKGTDNNASNFEATIDITGLTTLDITANNIYCGIINLTSSNATENIDEITVVNTPLVPFTLRPASGLTLTVTGTAVGSATTDDIVLPTATIVLDGTNGDWLQLQSNGTYSRQLAAENYI